MIIYKITNKINGKVYIGQTIQRLSRRWNLHRSKNSGCPALRNAFEKYGKENFEITVIDHAHTREELDNKEIYWIEFYNSLVPNGYNLHTGGAHHTVLDETRQKLSKAGKGKKLSVEHKKKIGDSQRGIKHHFFGKHFTVEHRIKMSKSRIGNTNRLGIPHSEETKRKISEREKGAKNPRARRITCVETGEVFDCCLYACQKYNFPKSTLCHCLKHRCKTCGGYHWRYVDEK